MDSLMEEKRILHPFITSNMLRIIAIILLMLGQTATMLLLYNKVTFTELIPNEKLQIYKTLTIVAMPLFLTSIITNITREPEKIKKFLLTYFVMAALFAVAEILLFYFAFVPFVEDLIKYALEIQGETTEEAHELSTFVLRYAMGYFANINVFLDLFLASLIAFFLLYTPKNATRKRLILFRSCVILPTLYIVASFILRGLFKLGYFAINIEQSAFLVHRNYLCFIYFAGVVVYQKYRGRLYSKHNKYMPFEEYKKSTGGLTCYNATLVSFLLALCLVDYLLGLIPGAKAFEIGKSYVLIYGLPVLFLFDSERRGRRMLTNLFSTLLYLLFGVVLFAGYATIIDTCIKYIGFVVTLIKLFLAL